MSSGFVSTKELDEEKQSRQEEWEKVRKPEDPSLAPEPEVCNKTLFEQLKNNKDLKQTELEEAKKFKNMIRGVDEDESEFLAQIDSNKHQALIQRKREEQEMLKEMAKTQSIAASSAKSSITLKPSTSALPNAAKTSKQASLIGLAIKRKSCSSAESSNEKIAKTDEVEPFMNQVGAIKGIISYEASSDSESDSSGTDGDDELPILKTNPRQKKPEQSCG